MFDENFLKDTLGKEDVSVEDKVALIMSEHTADITGLKDKNQQLLGEVKKVKEEKSILENDKAELEGKLTNLEEELKKNNPEDKVKLLENQFAEKIQEKDKAIADITAERDNLKQSNLKRILNESIEEGCKDLHFMDGLKDGFVAIIKARYSFEPKEIDGVTKFYTADMKEPKDVMKEFSLTSEGKAYIKNPSTGGGASNFGGSSTATPIADNPFKKGKSFNLTKQMQILRTDKELAERLKAEANQ